MWPPSSDEILIGLQNDSRRVPADGRDDAMLDLAIAGMLRRVLDGDGIAVGGIGGERDISAAAPGSVDHFHEDVVGPASAFKGDNRRYGVGPLAQFDIVALLIPSHISSGIRHSRRCTAGPKSSQARRRSGAREAYRRLVSRPPQGARFGWAIVSPRSNILTFAVASRVEYR